MYLDLAKRYLKQNTYYGVMKIKPRDLVKAYGVHRETAYHGNYDNEEGHNYERETQMRATMGASDARLGEHYWVWSVLADSFQNYLDRLLREEIA
jgi:hypothetical protein